MGIVTAEAGRLGSPRLFALGDVTGGIVVRLPLGATAFPRGASLVVKGQLADPYGQLELRPTAGDVRSTGTATVPSPASLGPSGPDESVEGRLVSVLGRLLAKPTRSAGGDLTFRFERSDGSKFTVQSDASSGIAATLLQPKATYLIVGIAGQRATRKGALDGYRIWSRDRNDLRLQSAAPTPTPSGSPRQSASAGHRDAISIAQALRQPDRPLAIEATVTAGASLLDASGRRIVVQDATGAIEILLPTGSSRPAVGARFRFEGKVGTAYGSPRLRATDVDRLAAGPPISALRLFAAPTASHLWRLVTVTGRIDDVHKLGDRWRAELVVGGSRVPIVGQPGSGIDVDRVVEGRTATVTGIVRAAYPSASDKRAAILPRASADLHVEAATGSASSSTSGGSPTDGSQTPVPDGSPLAGDAAAAPVAAPDVDLIELADFDGRAVRVGGIVVDVAATGFRLDDGTAIGTIGLSGPALELLALIEPGDVVNVEGTVVRSDDGLTVTTADPGSIAMTGDPVAEGDTTMPPEAVVPPASPPATLSLAGFDLPGTGSTDLAAIGTLAALTLGSLLMTLALRRARARRALARRVASRLVAIVGPDPATPMAAVSVANVHPRSRDSA